MSLILTFWEKCPHSPYDPDAFDCLLEVRLKSVKQIPELVARMPRGCAWITTEYSGDHRKAGKISCLTNPRRFKEIWALGQPLPQAQTKRCPLCGAIKSE